VGVFILKHNVFLKHSNVNDINFANDYLLVLT